MKGVFGEVASASFNVMEDLYGPTFSTQYLPGGQPVAPPLPRPSTSTRGGTLSVVSSPMPFSMAAVAARLSNNEADHGPRRESCWGRTDLSVSRCGPGILRDGQMSD